MTRSRPSAFDTVRVAGIDFADTSAPAAVAWLLDVCVGDQERPSVRLANAWSAVLAAREPPYLAVLNGEGVTFPDGASVTGTMRVLRRGGYRHGGRVRGPSLFVDSLDAGRERGLRHFLLGTTDPTLAALSAELDARFPGVQISGTYSPAFGPLDEAFVEDCRRRVAASESDIVWVALGVPKQDLLAHELSRRLNVTCVGVGAAFDMLAGRVREAPTWMQRLGLEWVFRLAVEPRRLWRRYLLGNVAFLRLAWKHR
ncbi:WecB/TagA/CpsF family glycosyltransferase [Nocardioides sp. HDW12B]|uniref:WecB/TagA/CpsF family glycosyltransferase n=1 Tax=Nocardioides sp. HDW12B TaxID=2714939 RepID=UPI001407E227|nr:WecB/TagA/CpsF family glycosyltransferase [Nocardioides sp. HDW12B]QIK65366.1 WecB/TagA/CpsF family glycosyltransferase [Nocardioides sp. HDW12B]